MRRRRRLDKIVIPLQLNRSKDIFPGIVDCCQFEVGRTEDNDDEDSDETSTIVVSFSTFPHSSFLNNVIRL